MSKKEVDFPDKVFAEYKKELRDYVVTNTREARFVMSSDGHPLQWDMLHSVLHHDLNVKSSYCELSKTRTYFITGRFKEQPKAPEIVKTEPLIQEKVAPAEPKADKLPMDVVSIDDVPI
jgi:hypothetical protein